METVSIDDSSKKSGYKKEERDKNYSVEGGFVLFCF